MPSLAVVQPEHSVERVYGAARRIHLVPDRIERAACDTLVHNDGSNNCGEQTFSAPSWRALAGRDGLIFLSDWPDSATPIELETTTEISRNVLSTKDERTTFGLARRPARPRRQPEEST